MSILDFSFEEVMKLQSIKRWGIIDMIRDQTVAEHSYNVTMICLMIINRIPMSSRHNNLKENIIDWALVHDLPEIVTGDIPTPFKKLVLSCVDQYENQMFMGFSSIKKSLSPLEKSITKIADLIDAIFFARKFCIDSKKEEIISDMKCYLFSEIHSIKDVVINEAISQFVKELNIKE